MRLMLLLLLAGLAGGRLLAQDDFPLDVPITLNMTVEDTISDAANFDWYSISLNEGDTIRIEMVASGGLVPLLGVIDADRNLIARSDDTVRGEPDGAIAFNFRAPETAEYRIVATREGNADGTSTGSYTLLVTLVSSIPTRENVLPEVTFRCDEMLITNAFSLRFAEDVPSTPRPSGEFERYTLTLLGYDGVQPVIRASAAASQGGTVDCSRDARTLPGSTFSLPGLDAVTVDEVSQENAAHLILRSVSADATFGEVTLTIGALQGGSGRFVAVLTGLSILDRTREDTVYVRLGPRSRDTTFTIYMISDKDSRLDPVMSAFLLDGTLLAECDDAGSRACPDVPSARDLDIFIADSGGYRVQGGRFDAGLVLQPQSADPLVLQLGSRNGDSAGGYSLVIIGEVR